MKSLIIIILLIFAFIEGGTEQKKATVVVEISGFSSNKGQIKSHIFHERNSEDYPESSDSAYKKTRGKIQNKVAKLYFNDIPYGNYALTVHHDENLNEIMDRNFVGYPKEAFGLSNNPKIYMSAPSFEECKFKVDRDTVVVNIKLKFV